MKGTVRKLQAVLVAICPPRTSAPGVAFQTHQLPTWQATWSSDRWELTTPALGYGQVTLPSVHWWVHGAEFPRFLDTHLRSIHRSPDSVHSVTWPKHSFLQEKPTNSYQPCGPALDSSWALAHPMPADSSSFLGTHTSSLQESAYYKGEPVVPGETILTLGY